MRQGEGGATEERVGLLHWLNRDLAARRPAWWPRAQAEEFLLGFLGSGPDGFRFRCSSADCQKLFTVPRAGPVWVLQLYHNPVTGEEDEHSAAVCPDCAARIATDPPGPGGPEARN